MAKTHLFLVLLVHWLVGVFLFYFVVVVVGGFLIVCEVSGGFFIGACGEGFVF